MTTESNEPQAPSAAHPILGVHARRVRS